MKILVVDDHHLIRDGLRPVLQSLAPEEATDVVEADSLAAALDEVAAHADFDLALLDLRLPDVVGFEAIARLRAARPSLPLVVMSGEIDPALMRAALDHGALGFIPKSSSSKVILSALRLVLAGGTYVPREAIGGNGDEAAASSGRPAPSGLDLTPRQMDVLRLMLAGKSNKSIGRELDLAEGTVKNHVAAVLKALGVTTRTQAVIAAAKRGLQG